MALYDQNTAPIDAINEILAITDTYTCMSQHSEMKGFFGNPNNRDAILEVKSLLGVPPKNRATWTNGFWSIQTHSYCDWQFGIYKFYLTCVLYKKYPSPSSFNATNCKVIKGLLTALDEEKTSLDRLLVANNDTAYHSYMSAAITDYQSSIRLKYATNSCDSVIKKQEDDEAAASFKKQTDDAMVNVGTGVKGAAVAATKNNNIVSVLAIIIVGVLILKIFKS
jgi:hypothetical protein